jgi:hypothetical protein
MADLALIKEHMHVHGSDDKHVGRVDHVKGDQIELAKLDLDTGFRHRYIPLAWVTTVTEDKVLLNKTHDEVHALWKDHE